MRTQQFHLSFTLLVAALLFAGCKSTSSVAPAEAADQIAAKLAAGERNEAERFFDTVDDDEDDREAIYAVLYEQAQAHYEAREYTPAAHILRFLVDEYSDGKAAKEALLYALFLERGRAGKASDEKTLDEMADLVRDLRGKEAPVWVDLAAAQVAADRKDFGGARKHLNRFREKWDGNPAGLENYLREIARFVDTEGGQA
ncbi:MAG: hypothetical protein V3T86_03780 [Planctomycetota bacterium]